MYISVSSHHNKQRLYYYICTALTDWLFYGDNVCLLWSVSFISEYFLIVIRASKSWKQAMFTCCHISTQYTTT